MVTIKFSIGTAATTAYDLKTGMLSGPQNSGFNYWF